MELLNRTLGILIAPCRSPATASEAQTPGERAASQPHSPLHGIFGAATLLIGILVLTGNMMLSPSDGQGLLQSWAQVILVLDSVWVLAYVPFLALLIARSAREIRADFPAERRLLLLCWVYAIGLVAVLALGLADLVESWAASGMLAGRPQAIALIPASLMAPASQAKMALLGASVLVAALLLLTWFFNLFNPGARKNLSRDPRASQRVLLRLGVADIVWRSRYVLFTLVFFAAIVLVMDQGRDVLVGMAQGIDKPERWPWVVGGIVISVLGVWVLGYACWLWSRVMARMLRPDDEVLGLRAGARVPDLGADDPAHRPPDGRDVFAKWWARLLGMAPFLMLAWLCGLASREAVRAGSESTGVLLFWFAAAAVLLAAFVLGARVYDKGRIQHSGPVSGRPSADKRRGRYFDVVGGDEAPCELSGPRYGFLWALPNAPVLLPILSLVLFQLVRGLDLMLDGRIPLTLAVIALGLSLWTSVLGLITQVALRQSVPWVLFLVLAIGVLGGLGWTDNHRVWTAASGATGPSSLWLMWGFQALLAVVVLAALTWVYFRVAASTEDEGTGCQAKFLWPRTWYGGPLAVSIVLLLSTALVLVGSDRLIFPEDSNGAGQSRNEDPLSNRQALDKAIAAWVQGLKTDWDQANASGEAPAEVPVHFVSAEGGGIRSAYWTALVLDRLSTIDPHFPRRTFSISGVSGGSVGAAVWHGCRANPEKGLPNCG
jgi:hypothetical protein